MGGRAMLMSLIPTHIYPFALQKCAGRTIFSMPVSYPPRIVHVLYNALINTIRASPFTSLLRFFVCIPILFSLVYRPGAFGWIGVAQVVDFFALPPPTPLLTFPRRPTYVVCRLFSVTFSRLNASHCIIISIARLVVSQ